MEEALRSKFDNNHNLQVLLTSNPTKSVDFHYAENSDPEKRYDWIIGIGKDGRGKNYTGKILSRLRAEYLEKQQKEDKLNADIAFLSNLFNNDSMLIGWFYSRGQDIINTVILFIFSNKTSK